MRRDRAVYAKCRPGAVRDGRRTERSRGKELCTGQHRQKTAPQRAAKQCLSNGM